MGDNNEAQVYKAGTRIRVHGRRYFGSRLYKAGDVIVLTDDGPLPGRACSVVGSDEDGGRRAAADSKKPIEPRTMSEMQGKQRSKPPTGA